MTGVNLPGAEGAATVKREFSRTQQYSSSAVLVPGPPMAGNGNSRSTRSNIGAVAIGTGAVAKEHNHHHQMLKYIRSTKILSCDNINTIY